MELLGAVVAGSFIGALLGFVGAGGAMLSVPILMYGFGIPIHQATIAALAIVCAAALSGARVKAQRREILYKEALTIWAIGSIANIYLATISERIADTVIASGFACVLVFAATSMLIQPRYEEIKRMSWPTLIAISLLIGSMTGLFGIGGGFLAIPVLVVAFHTPQAMAAGTSLLIIALNSATALVAHYPRWSEVTWQIPLLIAGSAIVIAHIASHHSSRANPVLLRRTFALLLYLIAVVTLVETWLK